MEIDFSRVKEGDFFFTHNNTPLGWIIRLATHSTVQHVGQFIKPFSGSDLFYRCEMVQDISEKQDLKIANPLKTKEIISIKRPVYAYKTEAERVAFRHRMIMWHEKVTISYDGQELLSHFPWFGSKKDKNKNNMICSRLAYENYKIDSNNKVYNAKFEKAVTPADLFNSNLLIEVDGWRT